MSPAVPFALLTAVVAVALDCSHRTQGQAGGAAQASPPRDTVVQGVVQVVGADPFAQVVIAGAPGAAEVGIQGATRSELAQLTGAVVRVMGRPIANAQGTPPRAVLVTSYEIVTVNGAAPVVGVLEERGGARWLGGHRLIAVPEELKRAVGAEVWVLGHVGPDGLTVTAYGIIAPVAKGSTAH